MFKNKIVLITGGASGLGKTITEEFLINGANCVITYNSNVNEALDLEKKYNDRILCIKCNLKNEDEIDNVITQTINRFNRIDILINNASISIDTEVESKIKQNFMDILEINLVGTFLISKKVINIMKKNKFGKIISISSNNSINSYYPESLDYDASKAGINSLTHNLSLYGAPYVTVNAVAPGWINTPMNKDMDSSFKKKEENKILMGRFAEAKEIAYVVLFLASDKANYINNEIIKVDGGTI